jgi:hypothetical protein
MKTPLTRLRQRGWPFTLFVDTQLRELRAEARPRTQAPDGQALAAGLERHCAKGLDYVHAIRSMIADNGSSAYDDATLVSTLTPTQIQRNLRPGRRHHSRVHRAMPNDSTASTSQRIPARFQTT